MERRNTGGKKSQYQLQLDALLPYHDVLSTLQRSDMRSTDPSWWTSCTRRVQHTQNNTHSPSSSSAGVSENVSSVYRRSNEVLPTNESPTKNTLIFPSLERSEGKMNQSANVTRRQEKIGNEDRTTRLPLSTCACDWCEEMTRVTAGNPFGAPPPPQPYVRMYSLLPPTKSNEHRTVSS